MSDELNEHHPTFTSLADSAPIHTQGEEPEVQDILKRYSDLNRIWTTALEGVESLLERSKPWAELTDRFDELCRNVEGAESSVLDDEHSMEQLDETEGGALSDFIVNFKVSGGVVRSD